MPLLTEIYKTSSRVYTTCKEACMNSHLLSSGAVHMAELEVCHCAQQRRLLEG